MLKTRNLEPKNWSLFDIVGTYSSGTYSALKVGLVPEEATACSILTNVYQVEWIDWVRIPADLANEALPLAQDTVEDVLAADSGGVAE